MQVNEIAGEKPASGMGKHPRRNGCGDSLGFFRLGGTAGSSCSVKLLSDINRSFHLWFSMHPCDWQQTEVVRREATALLGIDDSLIDPPISDTSN